MRWPLGEEPYADTPGTDGSIGAQHKDASEVKDGEWVNVQIEYTGLPPEPNQKKLLHLGAMTRLPCHVCKQPTYVAAAKSAREVLETAGYVFRKEKAYDGLEERVVIVACEQGHTAQFNEKMIKRLIKRE